MFVVNFSHPITEAQKSQIEAMVNSPIQIKTVRVLVDQESPFEPQVQDFLEEMGLSPEEWQQPMLVNLPGLSPVAVLLCKEIKQRVESLTMIRLQPIQGAEHVEYRVAELIHL